MAKCPECDEENEIEAINPGKTIKCAGCGANLEVIKEGKKKELYPTDLEEDEYE